MNSETYLTVKEMREKIEDFGDMLVEIANLFSEAIAIKINFKGLNEKNIFSHQNYFLDISCKEQTFNNLDTVIDLLESAFKESGIVTKDYQINSTLKNFFENNEISTVHLNHGNAKQQLINSFDKFIINDNKFELTFAQKINRLKRKF